MSDPDTIDKSVYADLEKDYLPNVLTDFITYWQVGQSYFPHSEYCETPYHSKMLNIVTDPTGVTYRYGNNKQFAEPDSSKIRIYVFGGSTSFGSWVADKDCWPSQLETLLKEQGKNVEVINYAIQAGTVTEEFLRLYDLIKLGHHPSLVIVMDGINLGAKSDISKYSKSIFNRVQDWQKGRISNALFTRQFFNLPIMKLLMHLIPKSALYYFYVSKDDDGTSPLESKNDSKLVNNYINRFSAGIDDFKVLCNRHKIDFLYFLQPNAFYNYPRVSSEIANPDFRKVLDTIYSGVKAMNPNNVKDLTNLFSKYDKKPIVDNCHYSVGFNSFIANEVARYINIDSLGVSYINSMRATGEPFEFFSNQ